MMHQVQKRQDWDKIGITRHFMMHQVQKRQDWDKIGITRHFMMHQVLYIVQLPNEEGDMSIVGNASFSSAFRNHGCSDRLALCFLRPVSCLTHAAALFLKNAIPSHAVYDSKATNCSHTVVIEL